VQALADGGIGGAWHEGDVGHGAAYVFADPDGQAWEVKRLYVGDGSLVPRTLSVNPSLTIMALADRLAQHLDDDPYGYLQ
jgi:choline dehydrogenase-like flavoprotein